MKKLTLYLIFSFIPFLGYQQTDTSNGYQYKLGLKTHVSARDMKKQYILEQRIENIAENNEDEDIDYTTLFDQLSFYYEHPINLNKKKLQNKFPTAQ